MTSGHMKGAGIDMLQLAREVAAPRFRSELRHEVLAGKHDADETVQMAFAGARALSTAIQACDSYSDRPHTLAVSTRVKPLVWSKVRGLVYDALVCRDPFGNEFSRLDLKAGMTDDYINTFKASAQTLYDRVMHNAMEPDPTPAPPVKVAKPRPLDLATVVRHALESGRTGVRWENYSPPEPATTRIEKAIEAGSRTLTLFDWAYTEMGGTQCYAGTPEQAERLRAKGFTLIPVYTVEYPEPATADEAKASTEPPPVAMPEPSEDAGPGTFLSLIDPLYHNVYAWLGDMAAREDACRAAALKLHWDEPDKLNMYSEARKGIKELCVQVNRLSAAHHERGVKLIGATEQWGAENCRAMKLEEELAALRADQWRNDPPPANGVPILAMDVYSMVWRPYSKKSEQYKRGKRGRWMRARQYMGWEPCLPPEHWKPDPQYAKAQPLSNQEDTHND